MFDLIGLVVPYYQNERLLQRTLLSIADQDTDSWRLIIIDDSGSEDDLTIPESLRDDPRVQILKNLKNLGPGKTWNKGVEIMARLHKVPVIAVIHADDELERNFVSVSLAAHTAHSNAAAVHTRASVINELGRITFSAPDFIKAVLVLMLGNRTMELSGDQGLQRILRGNFVFCPTMSFKTAELAIPLFDEELKMVADLDLISRLLMNGKVIAGVKSKAYRYRRHAQSLTSRLNLSSERFLEEAWFYRSIANTCESKGFHRSSRTARRMIIVRVHWFYQLLNAVLCGEYSRVKSLWKVRSLFSQR